MPRWRPKLRPARRWVVLPLALAAGGGAWFVTKGSGDDGAAATTTERVVEVTTGPLSRTVSAEGAIAAADTDDLSFTVAGKVTAVNVAAGDEVVAGQVLATLDSAELDAAVVDAEAAVADAEAQLADDEAADGSDAQIAADESQLAAAQADLADANEALAGAALVATIDGTVAAVNLTVGEELGSNGTSGTGQTGSESGSGQTSSNLGSDDATTGDTSGTTPHVQVVSTGSFVVELGIDATEVDLLAAGQQATVRPSTSSGGGVFPGEVGQFERAPVEIGEGGAATEGSAGKESDAAATARAEVGGGAGAQAEGTVASVGAVADASSGVASYPAEVNFEGSTEEFYVGATATVDIVYEEIADAIQVPSAAITTTEGVTTVVVDDDGDRATRQVETGISSGGMVQITTGLEAGESVVVTIVAFEQSEDSDDGGTGGEIQLPPGFDPSDGPPAGVRPGFGEQGGGGG